MSVEEFQAPASLVSVDGNVVGDELMDKRLWATSLALARKLPPTIQNTFDPNVANCCEDGTTSGFVNNSNAPISVASDWYVQGSKSLRINFDSSTKGHCWWSSKISASTDYTFRTVVHGIKGTKIRVMVGDKNGDSGAWRNYRSSEYVLSGDNDTITISYTSITGAATMYAIIYCEDTVARTVYVDSNINGPGNFPNTFIPNVATGTNTLKTTTGFGSWEAAISSVIEQAYKSTNSLKIIPNVANRRMFFRQIVPVGGGQYSLISVLKGKSGSKISICIEQADELNNQSRGLLSVGELTFDGTWQVIKWTGTLDNATTKVTPTFYVEDANAYFFGAASFHPGSEQKLKPSLVWSAGKGAVTRYPSGDTCILCQTLGSRANEGVNMYGFSQYERMIAVITNQRVWHSVYLQGSGTVKLYVYEFNANGAIVNSAITDTITLSEVWQRVDKDLTVTVDGYVCFGVETATTQSAQIRINDVYINKGDTARSGANLAADAIKNTGIGGTIEGFEGVTGSEVVSVDFDCDAIEATYSP